MKSTPERGYPYPECDPPLTKDAADIAQLRNLAAAVDTDVQGVYNRANDAVVLPDSARMNMSLALAGTDVGEVVPFFNGRTIDTTVGNTMTPTSEGYLRLAEPGWYSVGAYAEFTTATFLGLRLCFTLDGTRVTSYSTQAMIGASNLQAAHHNAEIFAPVGGGALSVSCRIGAGAASYTYAVRIWATQTVRL
jgi:hypothetical protein